MSPHNKRSSNIPDWMELSLILARFDTRCHKFLFTLIAWRWHRFCWLFNFWGGHKPQIKLKPCVKQDIWHMSCLLLWEFFSLSSKTTEDTEKRYVQYNSSNGQKKIQNTLYLFSALESMQMTLVKRHILYMLHSSSKIAVISH